MNELILVVALLGADASPSQGQETHPVEVKIEIRAPHEIRKEIRSALKNQATATNFAKQHEAGTTLCRLFAEMMLNPDFAEYEKQKTRAKLTSRLRSVKSELQKDYPIPESPSCCGAQGGGAVDARRASELIDLITTTIAPETWDIHGGKGSIAYYSNLRVLVIRQTQEVHEKIGGIQRLLRATP